MEIKLENFPLSEVYRLLESGPVVMLTSSDKGRDNVMSMSWHTMIDFEPPLIGCIVSNRDYTFDIIRKTRECVISIPTADMAPTVVKVGSASGKNTDKFEKFGLLNIPAEKVAAPLLPECYANIECKVVDMSMANKYNLFILRAVKAWINTAIKNPKTIHHAGKGEFIIASRRIKIPFKK